MTSGLPQTRPGAVTQPDQGLMERIQRLEALVEELGRRDMNRATVGQGGTFRGYYDNGQLAFTFGEDIDDGVRKVRINYASTGLQALQIGPGNPAVNEPEQFRMRDQADNNIFATDGVAGYGLAEPALTYFMGDANPFSRTSGVEDFAAESVGLFYNPCVASTIRVGNLSGITGGSARLVGKDANGTIVAASSTGTIVAGLSVLTKSILLPESMINAQNVKIQWLITPTGSGTLQTWTMSCAGRTKTYYDLNPSIQ